MERKRLRKNKDKQRLGMELVERSNPPLADCGVSTQLHQGGGELRPYAGFTKLNFT